MNKVLLDSSIIIDFLRRTNKEQSLLYQLAKEDYQLSMSIITYAELYSGQSIWEHKNAEKELGMVLQNIDILSLNEAIAKIAGQIRAKNGINLLDAIIAATALKYKLELITLNVKDFERIAGLKLKKI